MSFRKCVHMLRAPRPVDLAIKSCPVFLRNALDPALLHGGTSRRGILLDDKP
jgi:hypothetical protein